MSEDTHENPPGDAGVAATNPPIDDGDFMDRVEQCDDAPSKPLSTSEQISEIDSSNPVQSTSDDRDCDVEEVLRRTLDSVVSNVHGIGGHSESASPPAELALSSGVTSLQNMTPQISEELDDRKNANTDSLGDERLCRNTVLAMGAAVTDYEEDDFGDFGDFTKPHPVTDPLVINGIREPADAGAHDVANDEDDDDFGDFEEADFGKIAPSAPSGDFARFDDTSFNPENRDFPEESEAPASRESFQNLIAKLFVAVDQSSSDLLDRPVETGDFHANVRRDIARCEDVDNWPCVLFRYDSSRTRKTLLSSLCIDETPANCPRFAIDCLSNEFLQPVKEPRGGSLSVGSGDGRELSEKAKEVLSKIPDLSFMKAEVLTFPTTVQAP